jgi:molecular chaperone GrpE (heat shock protein)
MRWFWSDSGKSSLELEAIQQLKEQNNFLSEQYRGLAEQVAKLSRLQYKTSKDIQGKVDGLQDSFASMIKKQENDTNEKELRTIRTEAKIEELAYSLIRWLDDLDLIYSNMIDGDQEEWKKILKQWSNQILVHLKGLGIIELQVIGTSFDPTLAESIGTISKKKADTKYKEIPQQIDIPYQIVEVLKRGFIWKGDTLLRKAQVITLDKEKFYVE